MRIAVVGGGIAGLVAAFRLVERGHDVVCADTGDRPGGLVRTERRDGFLLETGPQAIQDGAPEVRGLIDDLGLASQVVAPSPAARKRMIYARGRLWTVPTSPPALLFGSLLTPGGRWRLVREPWIKAPPPDADESIFDFVARRLGTEAAERLAAPAVIGVFAGDARRLSMRSAFPRFADAEREHGSLFRGLKALRKAGVKSGHIVSFADGLEALPRALAERLGPRLVRARVMSVAPSAKLWRVLAAGDGASALEGAFDHVVLAASPDATAELLADLAPAATAAIREIPVAPAAVVTLGFRTRAIGMDLDAYGFLVARDAGKRILGVQYESTVFAGRAPEGGALLRVIVGGVFDPGILAEPDAAIVTAVTKELGEIAGLDAEPDLGAVFRWPKAIPQYELGHEARVRRIEEAVRPLPGLHLLGHAFRGVGLVEGIKNATKVAASLGVSTAVH